MLHNAVSFPPLFRALEEFLELSIKEKHLLLSLSLPRSPEISLPML
jgi:hypothetical protein